MENKENKMEEVKVDPYSFELVEDDGLEDISEDEFVYWASLRVPFIEIK